MTNTILDVRAYPISEPKGGTLAFASVAIDGLAAIRGIRLIEGEKGLFVSMPQSKDSAGKYHDVAFPLSGGLRSEISAAVIEEFSVQYGLDPGNRGYGKQEPGEGSGRQAGGVKLDVRVFPLTEPKGDTLAFASAGLDDAVAIRGIRVIKGEKGLFVSMPQSKDSAGKYHDVAFPLSGDLRRAINKAVLDAYKEQASDRKKSIGERIAEGEKQAAEYNASAPAKSAAKKAPGLGD